MILIDDRGQYALGNINCIFNPLDKIPSRGFITGSGSVRPSPP